MDKDGDAYLVATDEEVIDEYAELAERRGAFLQKERLATWALSRCKLSLPSSWGSPILEELL